MIVEFLGPSGVGKTTLAKDIFPQMHAIGYKSLNAHLAENHWNFKPSDFNEVESMLLELRLAHFLNLKPSALDLYFNTALYYHHMSFEVQARCVPTNTSFVSDEHVFQMFNHEMTYLISRFPDTLRPFLHNRAFVFMTRAPAKIYANMKKRAEAGEYRSFFDAIKKEDHLKIIAQFEKNMTLIKRFLKQESVSYLEIDLDQENSETKVLGFLQENFHRSTLADSPLKT